MGQGASLGFIAGQSMMAMKMMNKINLQGIHRAYHSTPRYHNLRAKR